jgi:hypothetical protein
MGLVSDIFKKETFKEDVLKLVKKISDKSKSNNSEEGPKKIRRIRAN